MRIGSFKHRTTCRFCQSTDLVNFLDLGNMPHAGDFLKKEQVGREKYYPLKVWFCKKCALVQILDIIPPSTLFKDYRYLSSVSLKEHFANYAKEMKSKYLSKNAFIVEIGSNDGVLLLPLKQMGFSVLGVDPSKNVGGVARSKGVDTLTDFFGIKSASRIKVKHGQADAIFANNVLAHIDDMQDVFEGIKLLLRKDGILVFEVHHLLNLIQTNQYDFIYTEHLNYYSVHSLISFLKRYDMEIFKIKKTKIHSGSIRVYVKFASNSSYKVDKSIKEIICEEDLNKLDKLSTFQVFSKNVTKHKSKFVEFISKLRLGNKKIVGYGASGRANTLLNYCGIDTNTLSYIVDESPERYGRFTPGTHIPIVPPEYFRKDNPDYAIILAWNYTKDIISKEKKYLVNGGTFVSVFSEVGLLDAKVNENTF